MKPRHPCILIYLIAGVLLANNLPTESAANLSGQPKKQTWTWAESACSNQENWIYNEGISQEWREEIKKFLNKKITPAHAFSDALMLRQISKSSEVRWLGEYWISRSLFQAGLLHIAHQGFNSIVAYPVTQHGLGIQIAALECLNLIQRTYPTLGLNAALRERITLFFSDSIAPSQREVLYEAAENILKSQLGENASRSALKKTLALFHADGAYEGFASALWASYESDHFQAIIEWSRFLKGKNLRLLKRYSDQAHLLLARAYFSQGQFVAASDQLKSVRKNSNELTKALSELAWSYLLNGNPPEAIGTALNLEAGGLRHTFAPESPMVMAMALNELCQFPESLKAIHIFWRNYEKSYLWLKEWSNRRGSQALYPLAIVDLKKWRGQNHNHLIQAESNIPDRISSEWIRSPIFISYQDELNLLSDERNSITTLGQQGLIEQRQIATDIHTLGQELKLKVHALRKSLKPEEPLPGPVRIDLLKLKNLLLHYVRFKQASRFWRIIINHHQLRSDHLKNKIISSINLDLSERTLKMFSQLEEISENNQLIEIEIYNGATDDIIWQNAHPDYKEMAMKLKDTDSKSAPSQVWDWGRLPAGSDRASEIWEDELGSFKANLYDNCSNREKYLALKNR